MSSVGVRGGGSPCFGEGTLIRTVRGEVAVEDLKVGDLAVTLSGPARPIVWIGHRRIEAPTNDELPIRIRAEAFGDGRPARDLRLSAGHCVCLKVVDEVLIAIRELAIGGPVGRERTGPITYWHVELESHDVIFAEGMPVESYLDCGDRGW